MTDVTNAMRAEWGRAAQDAFDAEVYLGDADKVEELSTRIGDLIGDLLHLARRDAGVTDLRKLLDDALEMHDTELAEDPEE